MALTLTLSKCGCGAWYSLHLMCANAKTTEEKKACLYLLNLYKTKFLCKACMKHLTEFMIKNPIEPYINEHNGLSVWSFKAHNNANVITGKPEITWEQYYNTYHLSTPYCDSGCGEHKESPTGTAVPIAPVPVPPSRSIPLGFRLMSPST